MYVIMGATGHVGGAAARALRHAGREVIAITREASHAGSLRGIGAEVAEADVRDIDTLRGVFRRGRRAFLLNPPADVSGDTDVEERETTRCILAALDGSGLERIVAESTYGAQPGERLGDLSVLHELEQGLRAQPIPATIQRAAYYMSNWDDAFGPVREKGELPTMLPPDLKLPMVAPADLGAVAARLLQGDDDPAALVYVEGPERYSSADVAAAFGRALGRDVRPVAISRDNWEATYRRLGFSAAAAASYARMTALSVDEGFAMPDRPLRGQVTLDAYVGELVGRKSAMT